MSCALSGLLRGLSGMAGGAEALEVLVCMAAAIDQRRDVVEFPKRFSGLEATFAQLARPASANLA